MSGTVLTSIPVHLLPVLSQVVKVHQRWAFLDSKAHHNSMTYHSCLFLLDFFLWTHSLLRYIVQQVCRLLQAVKSCLCNSSADGKKQDCSKVCCWPYSRLPFETLHDVQSVHRETLPCCGAQTLVRLPLLSQMLCLASLHLDVEHLFVTVDVVLSRKEDTKASDLVCTAQKRSLDVHICMHTYACMQLNTELAPSCTTMKPTISCCAELQMANCRSCTILHALLASWTEVMRH